MKKLFIIFIIVIIICGGYLFFFNKNSSAAASKPKIDKQEEKIDTPKLEEYVDNNPIKIGIYSSKNDKRVLVYEYQKKWQYHQDINTFNIFYTQEETIDNIPIRLSYNTYLDNYNSEEISKYKNGFHVYFSTTKGIVDKTILSPKDTEAFYDYLEVYLYDSLHRQAGEWYSHTTEEEFNDSTTLTSIKLTAGKNVALINSDIKLTAFTYDNDDFDENGNYRGTSKYSITIKNETN